MKMMKGMLLALIPVTLYALYSYRLSAFILISVSILGAVTAEAAYQKLSNQPLKIKNLSAVVTGLLFSFTLSPSTPIYAAAISVAFGIIVGKELFGGVGKNLFNPALLGRLFLIFAFPAALSPWQTRIDMVSTATPLGIFWDSGEMVSTGEAFLGLVPGSLGEMSALLILIGGIYIIYKKYARWRIPVSLITTVGIFALLMGHNPLFHIFTGSVMLGSFFYAVDPMTSPRFPKAQIVFGIGIALILMAMRFWGWLPAGMAFGVLIMNIFVPLLDKKFKA
ncbi:RnfABCDGE type electron transport complex subunit D [Halanaerobium hydrogeniformans]|uniref:Electron transport complex, RnfABCDGE type, D subunit n=1 Tax=Halanaerobium hydrogeniformans TaxID=656519 RepID=E4RN42_HALHG|nr:RnfABCDGE type electron transport complex subunit D [Halanaerobium hydrogeniformans]ADQ14259.1 electron transport complex, RnfABCDGE type, D subunit [Halanaerobium hydrogeniformans]